MAKVEKRSVLRSEKRQRERRWQGQQEGKAQAPVHERSVLRMIGIVMMLGEAGQQHRSERHAKQRTGKLHQAIGVADPGNPSIAEIGSELRIDQR